MSAARIPVYAGGQVAAYALVDALDVAKVMGVRWRLRDDGYTHAYDPTTSRRPRAVHPAERRLCRAQHPSLPRWKTPYRTRFS